MTKKPPAKRWLWLSARGQRVHLEEVHAPTKDDLKDLFQELMKWRKAQPEAMPPQLWDKLNKYIRWHMLPLVQWTQEQKDRVRWEYVCKGLARGLGWDGVFECASDALKGTQADAGPDMMKTSYQKIQKRLPTEKRRPRTYRRNPRLR